jgi:uncharacterized protein (TIGR03437 family)
LGAVSAQGALQVARTAVTGVLQDTELKPAFAGLTPQFIGLYQVNLAIPAALPPALDTPLVLRQGDVDSNTVLISVQ